MEQIFDFLNSNFFFIFDNKFSKLLNFQILKILKIFKAAFLQLGHDHLPPLAVGGHSLWRKAADSQPKLY